MLGSASFFLSLLLLILTLSALVALLFPSHVGLHLAHLLAIVGAASGLALAIVVLSTGATVELSPFAVAPFARFGLRVDALAAFFVGAIAFASLASSIYAVGYVKPRGAGDVRWLGGGYGLFLLSMILVVLADNAFTFLLVWELMAVVSFALVVHDHHDGAVRRAGFVYLVMSHLGTAFIVVAFLGLFAHASSFEFGAFRAAAAELPPLVRDAVFLLALIGLGTKAGVMPLHVWLPRAHPAAPSHVSALMSGVMIKTAIYGLLRFAFEFLIGPGAAPPIWWGLLIVGLGAVSAVLGVLYALMEHDLKRLLAYHSVENIGIILIGIGGALYLVSSGQPGLAAIALAAGLFHVLNHATFKGLLFLGAGAVQHAVHTRDIERMGGLLRRLPWTGLFFLVGSAAISGLPPLNGFVSEWLTFQTLLAIGLGATDGWIAVGAALVAGMLALTAALAATCFVKAFGITFLAMPRSEAAETAKESGLPMLFGMGILAFACGVFGFAPAVVFALLEPVTRETVGTSLLGQFGAGGWLMTIPTASSLAAPSLVSPVVWIVVAVLVPLPLVLGRLLGGPTRTRIDETWACGVTLRPEMEYNATSFSKPIRLIFSAILRPERRVEQHYSAPYFVHTVQYHGQIRPFTEQWLYYNLARVVVTGAAWLRQLQSGSIRLYLGYVFATLVILLLVAR